jgi:acyl dehydratase
MSGLWYEECEPGLVIEHATSRTVTEMDNVLFSSLTMNVQPLHIDEEFAATTQHGQRVVNGIFTLGLVLGMTVPETVLGTTLGVRAIEHVDFAQAVFHGDTIRAATTILDRRESRSLPDAGVVRFQHTGRNQRDEAVLTVRRVGLMLRRPSS